MTKHGLSLEERFWLKVNKQEPNSCWEWTGFCNHDGYGQFPNSGKTVRAHRFSYEIANGPIPEGLVIRHKCHNPKCVNPNHLENGTQKDNIRDATDQGRLRAGENHPMAKLTEKQAREIKEMIAKGLAIKFIADQFSVSSVTISDIKSGATWKHIT